MSVPNTIRWRLCMAGTIRRWPAWHYAAWDLWMLGYPEQAVVKKRSGGGLGEQLAPSLQPGHRAFVCRDVALLEARSRRHPANTRNRRSLFARSMESPYFWRWERSCSGGRTIRRRKAGKASTDSGGDRRLAGLGRRVGDSPVPAGIGWQLWRTCGSYEEALLAIEEALAVISSTGDRSFEADCWRWKGELLWRSMEGSDSNSPRGGSLPA